MNQIQQALAVAAQHKAKRRASGGGVHIGAITGPTPGRTDVHEMELPEGSYVLPADVVSHFGENNTEAGLAHLEKYFGPKRARKSGGGVPVITASGEYVIAPEKVKEIGGGSIDDGHKILDNFVLVVRDDHIKQLKKLPPPAQD